MTGVARNDKGVARNDVSVGEGGDGRPPFACVRGRDAKRAGDARARLGLLSFPTSRHPLFMNWVPKRK